MTLVLKDLCRRGGLGTVRKWIRIEFDGVPYCIACNIKEILLKCPKFNVEIDETILEFHLSEMHGVTGKSCLRGEKVSKDVLLVPEQVVWKKNPVISYIFAVS